MNPNGVLNIDLIPPWHPSSVVSGMRRTIESAASLRASVAYCTVDSSAIAPVLSAKLAGPTGFLCVDLHLPTDVDSLASFVRHGAAVYLYCERIKGVPGTRHLVHTKLLVFDIDNIEAELWVGSHNWTKAALGGLNVEASLVARILIGSPLYKDSVALLEEIRSVCELFDLNKIEYYKALQGELPPEEGEEIWSLELYGRNVNTLEGDTIAIFGEDERDLSRVRSLSDIVVTVFDAENGDAFNYEGRVFLTGPLERYDPGAGGLSLSPRRYALRRGQAIPELLETQEVEQAVMANSRFFITVNIGRYRPNLIGYDLPRRSEMWHKVDMFDSPLVSRMDPGQQRFVFEKKAPKVTHPGSLEDVLPQIPLLDSRLKAEERPLILKKLFRVKTP